jgi:hypothetical protein
MELHLRRQHPSWLRLQGGPWKFLNDQAAKSNPQPVEIRLFAPSTWPEAAAFAQPGQAVERVDCELADFARWMKRDARRRTASCLFVLVSEDPEVRREARALGLAVLEFAELVRRLGLGPQAARLEAESVKVKAPKDPAILKGGKVMGEAELRWWAEQLQVPDEPVAQNPQARMEEEEQRLARLLGAEEDDPRVLEHRDEEWMERNFPAKAEENRPRRAPKAKRR